MKQSDYKIISEVLEDGVETYEVFSSLKIRGKSYKRGAIISSEDLGIKQITKLLKMGYIRRLHVTRNV